MHVFVTGASGFIGRAVVAELVASGHEVTGLARSEKSASIVTNLGAAVHRGVSARLGIPAGRRPPGAVRSQCRAKIGCSFPAPGTGMRSGPDLFAALGRAGTGSRGGGQSGPDTGKAAEVVVVEAAEEESVQVAALLAPCFAQ